MSDCPSFNTGPDSVLRRAVQAAAVIQHPQDVLKLTVSLQQTQPVAINSLTTKMTPEGQRAFAKQDEKERCTTVCITFTLRPTEDFHHHKSQHGNLLSQGIQEYRIRAIIMFQAFHTKGCGVYLLLLLLAAFHSSEFRSTKITCEETM